MNGITRLRVGDEFPPDAFDDLVDHDAAPWRPSGSRPLVLVLHRHLA